MSAYTTKCVYCLKRPAKVYGGHVRKGGGYVLAGWCNLHLPIAELTHAYKGWFGHWVRAMGSTPRPR